MKSEIKNIKDNSGLNRLLILNKIKHKPLLFFKILPFENKRPFILPYLIDSDFALKNSLKKVINKIKTKNFLAESFDNIYKFVIYKFMKDIDILSLGVYLINDFLYENKMSFQENYEEYIVRYFRLINPIPKDINIPYKLIEKFLPNGETLKNFF